MLWVCRAIEALGHECVHILKPDELVEADRSCDLIIFQHKGVIRWPNLREIHSNKKSPWVQWWFDLMVTVLGHPLVEQPLFVTNRDIMLNMDAVFVKELGLIEEYREAGVNAFYLDQGCPSHIREIERVEPEWDILTWGQTGPAYKIRFKHVREFASMGYRVAWATESGEVPKRVERLPWCHPEELWKLAGRAKIVLSIDMVSRLAGYMSDRFWLAAGMGCCVLQQCDFHRNDALPVNRYRTPKSSESTVKRLQNTYEQNGKTLRKWVMSSHTIEHRLLEMFHLLQRDGILADTVVERGLCTSKASDDAACVANVATSLSETEK